MKRFFSPAVKLLNKFRYIQKFILIGMIFIFPLIVVMYLLISEINLKIDFAGKERLGVAYISALKELLQDVQEYGQTRWLSLSGESSLADKIEPKVREIDADIKAIDQIDLKKGKILEASRGWLILKREIQYFLDVKLAELKSEDDFYGYHSFCKKVMLFISRIGDSSNLILDPDLDSYYLMDAFVNKIPLISESLDEAGTLSFKVILRQAIGSEAERLSLSGHYGDVGNNLKLMNNGFQTALDNNPRLIPLLGNELEQNTRLLHSFGNILNTRFLNVAAIDMDLPAYRAVLSESSRRLFNLYDIVGSNLDRLLSLRIQGFKQKEYFAEGISLLLLLIVVYFIIAFYLSVKNTVARLNEVAERLSGESSAGENVILNNKDELGDVAVAFNKIGSKLKEAYVNIRVNNEILEEDIARRREVEKEVKRLNEELEQKILERTASLETLNIELKGDIERRRQMGIRLSLQYDITRILASASEISAACPKILQLICETLGWDTGGIWLVDLEANALRLADIWHPGHFNSADFEEISRKSVFPLGIGLPGKVWISNASIWIEDLSADAASPRVSCAIKTGLSCALAFPIRISNEVAGVFEFFRLKPFKPDGELLQMFDAIGRQTGQFIKRSQAEEEIKKLSQAVEQSPSIVVIADTRGNIEYVNRKFSQLTGYSFEEVKGKGISILKSGQTPPEVYKELWTNILSGKEWKGELLNRKKNGEFYWEATHIFPLLNSKGQAMHFVALKEDISARKIVEVRLNVQYAVTRILAASSLLAEAGPRILQIVGENLGWDWGSIWLVDRPANVLACSVIWHLPQIEAKEFEEKSRAVPFSPGVGLPGRVWTNNAPAWIEDVTVDKNFPRAPYAARAGLHAAFGFPIRIGAEVIGMFEFFSHNLRRPDEELLQMFDSIGEQVGQLVKRSRAEEEIRKLNASLESRIIERTQQLEVSNRGLQEANRFNVLLLKTIPFGMDIVDEECNVLFMNQQLEGIFGKEAIGRKCWDLYKDNHAQCADCPIKRKNLELGQEDIVEVSGVLGGRIFQISHVGMTYQGRKAMLEIFEDITQRKQAEEEMRLVSTISLAVSQAEDVHSAYNIVLQKVCLTAGWPYGEIWTPNPEGSYLECYLTWCRDEKEFAGFKEISRKSTFKPGIGLPGRAWLSKEIALIHDLEQDKNFPRLPAAREAGFKSGIAIPITAENEVISIMVFFTNKFEERQSTQLFLAVASQLGAVLRRKQVEEELKNAYVELKSAQSQLLQSAKMASVGQLAGGVAHEINNPLTGVLNNVQLIKMIAAGKEGFKIEDFRQLLDIIEESALRCVKITRSLLDFSHASKETFQKVKLDEIVDKVMTLISYEMKLQNVTLEKQLEPELPLVLGDPQLLQQALFDLITNARWAIHKRSQNGNGRIIVKTEYDRQNRKVILSLADNGVGIPKENLERIFDPFFTTKPVGEGTGLGLAIIYNIVKKHNGMIEVESEVDKGAVFKISLPVAGEDIRRLGN